MEHNYEIKFKESIPGYLNLELWENWKTVTFSDFNISKDFLYKFWEKYVFDIIRLTKENLNFNDKISPNKLINNFSLNFLFESNYKKEFINFTNDIILWQFNNSTPITWDNENYDEMKEFERIAWVFFNICQFKNQEWLLNAKSKLISLVNDYKTCNENIYIDNLYFKFIDQIDNLKTYQYSQLTIIKAFQEKENIDTLYFETFDTEFLKFIKRKNIDSIAIIPNNVVRQTSFNQVIYDRLNFILEDIYFTQIIPTKTKDRLPQKTIRWLCNRIKNAEKLYEINDENIKSKKHILIIDDVFWSWATMNMIAKKIKDINPKIEITWFAILGSYRTGFDIVNEI